MKIFCPATKDSYITNKVISNNITAEQSNLGQAGTLDLFKLYQEDGNTNEISRILIKFDLKNINDLINDTVDINHHSFNAKLRLFDVKTGHQTPTNYAVMALPLAKNFDEGVGIDVAGFSQTDIVNFLTASYSEGNIVKWNIPGALDVGSSTDDVDIIENYFVDGNSISTVSTQFFLNGHDDLILDVTNAISGVISGELPDNGFLICFSGSYENDDQSRYAKRFASRHTVNPQIRPRLEISYDDSLKDHHANFRFDQPNNLYFGNQSRNGLKNFVLDSNLNEANGDDCLKLKISYKEFEQDYFVSQVVKGTNKIPVEGLYVAENVFVSSFSNFTGSVNFNEEKNIENFNFSEKLLSLDLANSYHECSFLAIKDKSCNKILDDVIVNSTNIANRYNSNQKQRIRVFVNNHIKKSRARRTTTLKKKSEIYEEMHYRLVDSINGNILFDFDFEKKSTLMSYDSEGMFFDFYFSVVPLGRAHYFEFAIVDNQNFLISKDDINFFVI